MYGMHNQGSDKEFKLHPDNINTEKVSLWASHRSLLFKPCKNERRPSLKKSDLIPLYSTVSATALLWATHHTLPVTVSYKSFLSPPAALLWVGLTHLPTDLCILLPLLLPVPTARFTS
jgi:hypothetical protein